MSLRDEILQQALALPVEDRAFVLEALEESLPSCSCHPRTSAQSGFLKELQNRAHACGHGHSQAREATVVLAELRQRQRDEATP